MSENYLGSWIGREGEAPVSCPAPSPDFNPFDFPFPFLLSYLRATDYVSTLDTRENSGVEFDKLFEIFVRLQAAFPCRATFCVREYGDYFENPL
jgi:hypothetical protein